MNIYLYDVGQTTKVATLSIYGKHPLKSSFIQWAYFKENWYVDGDTSPL